MQVRCIRARVGADVGDVVEVPDGAAVSPLYFEVIPDSPPTAAGVTPGQDSTPPANSPESSAPDEKGAGQ